MTSRESSDGAKKQNHRVEFSRESLLLPQRLNLSKLKR
jgi:hypothetical protein